MDRTKRTGEHIHTNTYNRIKDRTLEQTKQETQSTGKYWVDKTREYIYLWTLECTEKENK